MTRVDGFSESVFTDKGKLLFMQDNFLRMKVSSFAYSSKAGTISEGRTTQNSVKIKKPITAGSMYQDNLEQVGGGVYTTEDNVGYLINTAIYAYERSTPFNIEEVGLYALNPTTNEETLVWVGKLKDAVLYDPKTDVTVNIYVPITNKDIKIDLYTDPQRIREHNTNLDTHLALRELAENSKLYGFDEGKANEVILNSPTWEKNKFFANYREPKMYMFEPKFTNSGKATFKERGKKAYPVWLLGNELEGGELEGGIPTTVVYKATPTPHFSLIPSQMSSEKRTVWRYEIKEDGEKLIPTSLINKDQDIDKISINIEGAEVIDLKDFSLVEGGITTNWNTLKKGQRVRVEALKIGQAVSQRWNTWRIKIEQDGKFNFPTVGIAKDQTLKNISVNIQGLEIIDLTGFQILEDSILLPFGNLKKGQMIKIEALKKGVFANKDTVELASKKELDDLQKQVDVLKALHS